MLSEKVKDISLNIYLEEQVRLIELEACREAIATCPEGVDMGEWMGKCIPSYWWIFTKTN